jgi:hypothetical protein
LLDGRFQLCAQFIAKTNGRQLSFVRSSITMRALAIVALNLLDDPFLVVNDQRKATAGAGART